MDRIFILLIIFIPTFFILAAPIIKGAPYLPIDRTRLKALFRLTKAKKSDKVADLGSGDGRIVIEFAKRGIESHGYEINPLLVIISKIKIKKSNLQNKAFIHWRSFWNIKFSNFNIITAYPVKDIMKSLEQKLKNRTTKGTKIILHIFKFPNWNYTKKMDHNYLYIKN
jgi:ribosomal protein L11 methylase PrmA